MLNISKYHYYLFAGIIILAVLLRFWGLTGNDLTSDDALYSFRALGWFDYLGGGQTTPVQWFDQIPWWGNLSFHDAPPLGFAVQKIFFLLLGPTTLAAKLPFALAGLATVIILYYLLALARNQATARWGGLILAVSSYAVWGSRVGYLEGIEILPIILSVFFFVRYLKLNRPKDLWLWGVTVGLALLVKYTALFLLPAAFLYLLIWRRQEFKNKNFWLALALLAVVLLPVIIYNFEVWQARGHFDAALSSMVGLHPEDFAAVSARGASFNPGENLMFMVRALRDTSSWPFFLLWLAAGGYLIYKFYRKRTGVLERVVLINLALLVVMFLFTGAGPRFFLVSLPFWAAAAAIILADGQDYLRQKEFAFAGKLAAVILTLIIAAEVGYAINTNVLVQPRGQLGLAYSPARFNNRGFNELDNYLRREVFPPLPRLRQPRSLAVFNLEAGDFKDHDVYLVDETIDWFAYTWYIQKYPVYYGLPVISFNSFLASIPPGSDPLALLKQLGVKNIFYIYALADSVKDSTKMEILPLTQNMAALAGILERRGAAKELITNRAGQAAFAVYQLKL